ncbi:MAG: VanW family protein [Ornithinibacter sp.]
MSLDTFPQAAPEESAALAGRRWLIASGVVLLTLGVLYGATAWWLGDRVARGTTVSGVAIGGQSAEQARQTLSSRLVPKAGEPVSLISGAGKVELVPADVGLAVDVDATVDSLVGFTLDPATMWHRVAGGGPQRVAITVDRPAFEAAVEQARGELDAAPVEGSLSLEGGVVALKNPVGGTRTDAAGTLDAVRAVWPGRNTITVVAEPLEPKVSRAELNRVRTEFADLAVSAPVTVTAGGKSAQITPKAFAPSIVLAPAPDGTITPAVDEKALLKVVHAAARRAGLETTPKDAVVTFSGRTPSVRPSVAGLSLDEASVTTEVWKAIGSTTRTAVLATTPNEPEFTTAMAKATLPKGVISSFTTYYQPGQPRVENIKLASKVINGTYIPPGEQFSMNGILGERTPEKGYVEAGVINNGRAANNTGGGISQVSTTIFNAAFFSGMKLDAWTPHYYYISRYPEGREATVSWPDLHNKFTNVTDGGVLIEIIATDTSMTVTFYGTKKYDVEATKSLRYNIRAPKKIVDNAKGCVDQSPVEGFTVDVGRIFKQGGKVVKTEKFTTNYGPEDDVTCTR